MYIYMVSSKMAQMNLFAGQGWRCRHNGQTGGHSARRGGGDEWESSTEPLYTTTCNTASQ